SAASHYRTMTALSDPESATAQLEGDSGGGDVEITASSLEQQQQQSQQDAADSPSISATVTATHPKTTQTLEAAYRVGEFKANVNIGYLLVQSVMAGLFKSIGCTSFLVVGGGVLGAALFPVGLIAITLTSTELFTGDLLILTVSFLSKRVTLYSVIRNHVVAWCGNFVGTLLWASIIGYASGTIVDNGADDFAIELAILKTTQPWGHIVGKAVGANFLRWWHKK
ncbi:MAG: hypothetical protein SGILL_007745, partial [Bacillariaceae sp.]